MVAQNEHSIFLRLNTNLEIGRNDTYNTRIWVDGCWCCLYCETLSNLAQPLTLEVGWLFFIMEIWYWKQKPRQFPFKEFCGKHNIMGYAFCWPIHSDFFSQTVPFAYFQKLLILILYVMPLGNSENLLIFMCKSICKYYMFLR